MLKSFCPVPSHRSSRTWMTARMATMALMVSLISAVTFASASHGAPAKADASTGTGGVFVPTQGRVMDTRSTGSTAGTGGYTTSMATGLWRSVPVGGVAGVPMSGAGAVQVTVTALSPGSTGTVQLSADLATPKGGTALAYGSLSGNISNTAIVTLASDGKIQVEASSTVNLLVDVQGYYTSGTTTDGGYAPVTPARLVDTRNGMGVSQTAPLTSGSSTTITVAGKGGVPADATAVFVNFTVTNNTNGGLLTPYSSDLPRPTTSLNFEGGVSTALGTTVDLSPSGQMTVYMTDAGAALDLVVDVFGYFSGSSTTGAFTPATARVATNVSLPASSVTEVHVGGVAGVPPAGSGVFAVAANLQVTQTGTATGYIRAWSATDDEPSTSSIMLEHQPSTVSNFLTVELGKDGGINLRNVSTDDVTATVDVQGWYSVIETDANSSTDSWLSSLPRGYTDNQDVLTSFNGWLQQRSSIHDLGYVASIDDATTRTVTLLWNGSTPIPSDVTQAAVAQGITLTSKVWPLSYSKIQQTAQMLADAGPSTYPPGFTLADVVGIDPDYAGITVEGTYDATLTSSQMTAATAEMQTSIKSLTDAPVRTIGGISTQTANGRDTDFAPFNAGGLMYSPSAPSDDNICSSGFAIYYNAFSHITTARHCPYTDYKPVAHSGKYSNGFSVRVDSGAARYLGGTGAPLAFDGAYNRQDYYKTVVGYGDVSINDKVCTDGGNSGVHCNVKVTDLSVYFDDKTGHGTVETIKGVQQTSGKIAVIQGDSGGPVILPLSGGTKIKAVGMIQGFQNPSTTGTACGSAYFRGANKCSKIVLFTSERTIVNGIGPFASLITN